MFFVLFLFLFLFLFYFILLYFTLFSVYPCSILISFATSHQVVVGPTPSSATARLRTASLRECIAETADGERSPTVSFLDMICLVSPSKAAPILFSDIATSQMYLFCLIGLLVDLIDFCWLVSY